jgi:type I site-specific restriction endonuclease
MSTSNIIETIVVNDNTVKDYKSTAFILYHKTNVIVNIIESKDSNVANKILKQILHEYTIQFEQYNGKIVYSTCEYAHVSNLNLPVLDIKRLKLYNIIQVITKT